MRQALVLLVLFGCSSNAATPSGSAPGDLTAAGQGGSAEEALPTGTTAGGGSGGAAGTGAGGSAGQIGSAGGPIGAAAEPGIGGASPTPVGGSGGSGGTDAAGEANAGGASCELKPGFVGPCDRCVTQLEVCEAGPTAWLTSDGDRFECVNGNCQDAYSKANAWQKACCEAANAP